MKKTISEIVKEFDKKFVVDEMSAEIKNDGSMGMTEDTRLIADYIDGKTLTAKMIEDWLTSELNRLVDSIAGEVEGMKYLEMVGGGYRKLSKGDESQTDEFTAKWHNEILDSVVILLHSYKNK